jgi:hypothetical protein
MMESAFTAHGTLWWTSCSIDATIEAALTESYRSAQTTGLPIDDNIMKDVPRTMPEIMTADDEARLARVLHGYSRRDPVVGYNQSMSYIAAQLLRHMPEEKAFCVLVCIFQDAKVRRSCHSIFPHGSSLSSLSLLLLLRLPLSLSSHHTSMFPSHPCSHTLFSIC